MKELRLLNGRERGMKRTLSRYKRSSWLALGHSIGASPTARIKKYLKYLLSPHNFLLRVDGVNIPPYVKYGKLSRLVDYCSRPLMHLGIRMSLDCELFYLLLHNINYKVGSCDCSMISSDSSINMLDSTNFLSGLVVIFINSKIKKAHTPWIISLIHWGLFLMGVCAAHELWMFIGCGEEGGTVWGPKELCWSN